MLLAEFEKLSNVPRLLPLGQSGSLAVSGRNPAAVFGAARRLMLDILVLHSPQDVYVFVLGDNPEAEKRWEWLKWVPHTDALGGEQKVSRLSYTPQNIEKTLEFLSKELATRTKASGGSDTKKGRTPAMVVLVDDTGRVRAREDVIQLTELGADAGIHLIFAGGREWPRECKSRIDLVDDRRYKFIETWSRERAGHEGIYETASPADCEETARALGGIEAASSQTSIPLPKSIRLSEVIGIEDFSAETVKQNWAVPLEPKDLLQFPIGVKAKRDHLEMELINLLPAERGGSDAYHTILIGTTGSGKSEFMKSLVMGAAYRYSPLYLNLFFMDFKGGAAFSVFESLPHVSGIVTNLKPELVERGLDSVTNEIERRQTEFAAAKVQNIWDYNRNHPEEPMPHLVLFLDEFARGLADFPRLREPLDVLVRQGRSLGVYLILANQDVNSEVDKLLNNVGWRIALKVAKPDEMSMIDRTLPIATRAGHGYLRALSGNISEFQAGYGGYPVRTEEETTVEGFSIYRVDPDGAYEEVFKKQAGEATSAKKGAARAPREEEQLVKILRQATEELNLKPASKIYLDPLEENIPLEKNMADTGVQPKYAEGKWRTDPPLSRLLAAVGEVDLPKQCRQEQLAIDFDDRDGHLWLLGGPGSGKDTSLVAILMSVALTYTPEEVQFYLLEMGAGELVPLENLPHTGVCIRLQATEKERLERLFNFLDAEMERRIAEASKSETENHRCLPVIFLVINNTAEFRANFPDEADRVNRYVRDGKAAGIHILVTTNRSAELMRTVAQQHLAPAGDAAGEPRRIFRRGRQIGPDAAHQGARARLLGGRRRVGMPDRPAAAAVARAHPRNEIRVAGRRPPADPDPASEHSDRGCARPARTGARRGAAAPGRAILRNAGLDPAEHRGAAAVLDDPRAEGKRQEQLPVRRGAGRAEERSRRLGDQSLRLPAQPDHSARQAGSADRVICDARRNSEGRASDGGRGQGRQAARRGQTDPVADRRFQLRLPDREGKRARAVQPDRAGDRQHHQPAHPRGRADGGIPDVARLADAEDHAPEPAGDGDVEGLERTGLARRAGLPGLPQDGAAGRARLLRQQGQAVLRADAAGAPGKNTRGGRGRVT